MILQCAIFLVSLGLMASAAPLAQKGSSRSDPDGDLRRELIRMGEKDQKYRDRMDRLMKNMPGPENKRATREFLAVLKKQDEIDRKNIKRLDEIISRYGWPTRSMVGKEASNAALIILQHADLSYQKKYFPLVKEAAAGNEALAANVATLEDRILMREGKKQIYGTQVRINDVTRKLELYPIEDEENVDKRRAGVGLPPIAEYLKMFGLDYSPPKK
ncbi:MAG TPA: DUF6624 domain-containing protein [Blastocatellia bacterium]|jgi:hypothetical protein|nr:DUF6624 domain-containing protein [Blastocatellia bacterium]